MTSQPQSDRALMPAPPSAGQVARQEFGVSQLEKRAETAAVTLAAAQEAMVKARYVMALQRPRDLDDVRTRILREIEREGFAQAAWYRKPVGEGVEGLSVRFAETAMRCMGNIHVQAPVIYEDESFRLARVLVTDLETNITIEKDLTIQKVVERRFPKKGQEVLGTRTNSKGEATFLVRATEDEMLAKEGALFSKYMRNGVLRILPGDIQDAAKKRIKSILEGDAAKDPEGERRRIADAFAGLNILPSDLKGFLGHELSVCTPAELVNLRGLHTAIKAGEVTWAELVEQTDQPAGEGEKPKAGLAAVVERLKPKPPTTAPTPAATPVAATVVAPETQGESAAPAREQPYVEGAPLCDSNHEAARPYVVKAPKKVVVCPDCTLNVKLAADGAQIILAGE